MSHQDFHEGDKVTFRDGRKFDHQEHFAVVTADGAEMYLVDENGDEWGFRDCRDLQPAGTFDKLSKAVHDRVAGKSQPEHIDVSTAKQVVLQTGNTLKSALANKLGFLKPMQTAYLADLPEDAGKHLNGTTVTFRPKSSNGQLLGQWSYRTGKWYNAN